MRTDAVKKAVNCGGKRDSKHESQTVLTDPPFRFLGSGVYLPPRPAGKQQYLEQIAQVRNTDEHLIDRHASLFMMR